MHTTSARRPATCNWHVRRSAALALSVLATSLVTYAAETPPQESWQRLAAERMRLAEQFESLNSEGRQTEEIAPSITRDTAGFVATKEIFVCRQLVAEMPVSTDGKRAVREAEHRLIFLLNWFVDRYTRRSEWAAAIERQRELADFQKRVYGENDYRTADARREIDYLETLAKTSPRDAHQVVEAGHDVAKARQWLNDGQAETAANSAQTALNVYESVLGKAHWRLAEALSLLGQARSLQGEVAKAETLYSRAFEIREKALGKNHPAYAATLNDLAMLYLSQGAFAQAEPYCRQAADIYREKLDDQHADYAVSLNNLAVLYDSQGDYVRAEPCLRQALEIKRRALSAGDVDNATSLRDLALLYNDQGQAMRSEPFLYNDQSPAMRSKPFYHRALRAQQEAVGEARRSYVITINNLALLCYHQGDYARAESLYQQAAAVMKAARGEKDSEYAAILNNLGGLYKEQNDFARAEHLYQQAMEIMRDARGEKDPNFAGSLNNLAMLYQAQGKYERAEQHFREALEIRKITLGLQHPDYAISLNNLAGLYKLQRQFAEAARLYAEVLQIRGKTLGANHPDYANTLANVAELYAFQGDYAQAEPRCRGAVEIARKQIELTAAAQSERQQLAMLRAVRGYLDLYVTLMVDSGRYTESTYREVLAWKGCVLRRTRQIRAVTDSAELTAAFQKLQTVATQLATVAWRPPGPLTESSWRDRIAQLSTEKDRLERELAARSIAYQHATQEPTLEAIQASLPDDAVLVDFLEYSHCTLPDTSAATKPSAASRLVAFIARRNKPVEVVPLGAAEPIHEAVHIWRTMSPESAAGGKLLRKKVWEPIEGRLGNARIVLVSPDGALGRLPLGALPGKEPASYLLEERAIVVVPVPQLIPELAQDGNRKSKPKNMLVMGNIDYDMQPDTEAPQPTENRRKKFGRAPSEGLDRFSPLPGTKGEIATIEKLYRKEFGHEGLTTLERAQASKQAFLAAARDHRYLHVATHGFFATETQRSAFELVVRGHSGELLLNSTAVSGMHPGLLSGLALAGANRAGAAHASQDLDADDGILTAEEIGTLNLDGVQLVALSACETGLGKAAGGEGLLGLQRAFQAAGARTVIASFWKVPDQETRTLMERFYENHWHKNQNVLEALREAQLWMLNGQHERGYQRTDQPRDTPARPSPYYWAAFTLSGDWR